MFTIAEIVPYHFLEFTNDCYGVDMTKGSGGDHEGCLWKGEVVEEYPKLREFDEAFRM